MSTDYSKMSDFEINAAVFETLHGGTPDHKEGAGGEMVLISYEGDVVGGDAVEVEVERGVFNPCNNPSDAWQIIIDNKISIVTLDNKWLAAPTETVIDGVTGDSEVCFYASSDAVFDVNPLRAAMVVFLMMQESKNAS